MRNSLLVLGVATSMVVMLLSLARVISGRRAGAAGKRNLVIFHVGVAAISGVVPIAVVVLPLYPILGMIVCLVLLTVATIAFMRTP